MKNSIKQELLSHVVDRINDLDLDSFEELHYHCFNEDYYIIGYYQAEQWLQTHGISAFEAIGDVIEWEEETLGEISLEAGDINAEKIVNMYVYIKGEELLSEYDLDQSKESLLEELQGDIE